MLKLNLPAFFMFHKKKKDYPRLNLSYGDPNNSNDSITYLKKKSAYISNNNKSVTDIVNHLLKGNPEGIIINEFVFAKRKNCKRLLKAIQIVKEKKPYMFIALWVSVRIPKYLLKFAKNHIDLLLIEEYWPWESKLMLWFTFKHIHNKLIKYNVLHKSVFALGLNNQTSWKGTIKRFLKNKDGDLWKEIPWNYSNKTKQIQINYIKNKCNSMLGLGCWIYSKTPKQLIDDTYKYLEDYLF